MKKRTSFSLIGLALLLIILLLSGSMVQGTTLKLQATEPAELPPDTPMLEFDKPIIESLTGDNPGRLYKFEGKTEQLIKLSFTPKSGDFYTIVNLLDSTLQNVLGSIDGLSLVGGSLIVKLPEDGVYVVSVDYGGVTPGTPAPGRFEVLLSTFELEP